MALSIDGTPNANSLSGTSLTVTLTTTLSSDLIIIDVLTNAGPISTVSSPTLGSFQLRATSGGASGNDLERWYAVASGPLTSEVITISQTGSGFMAACGYAINGANTSSPWQVASVTSAAFPSDPLSITLTGAAMIVGCYRMNSTASPTAGSGYTLLSGANFHISEYAIEASSGAYSVTLTTGAGDSNGGIIDAVVAASGAAGIAVWPYRM